MLCASRERAAHRSRKEMLWEGRGHEMPTLIFRLDTCSLEAEMRARAHYETVVSVLTLFNKRGGRSNAVFIPSLHEHHACAVCARGGLLASLLAAHVRVSRQVLSFLA